MVTRKVDNAILRKSYPGRLVALAAVCLFFVAMPAQASANSAGVLTLQLLGDNPFTNQCHAAFSDPGATAGGSPIALAAGSGHSLALKPDGTVVAWGRNDFGQTNVPAAATNVIAIAAGYSHNLALRANGTVVTWGYDEYGLMDVPAAATNVIAIATGQAHSLVLKADGTVVAWGYSVYGQTDVPAAATNVIALEGGYIHSLVLKADGTLLGWGYNGYGQTDMPAAATNIIAISAGAHHNLAQRADGTLLAWRYNVHGQTDIPASVTNVIAFSAGEYHNLVLKADGTVVAFGNNDYGQTDVPVSLTNAILLAAGEYFNLAMKADGTVVGWGYNADGQTNVPAGVTLSLPVTVSGSVNTNVPGNYTLTYTATNNFGNVATATRTVVIADTTPPVITVSGSNPLTNECYSAFVDPGATANDLCSGSCVVTANSNLNLNLPGTYAITYTAADSFGNAATNTRTVVVVDTRPPVVTLNGLTPILVSGSRAFTDPGATAVDPGAGSLPVIATSSVNVNFPGVYDIVYRATDASGNSGTNSRTVLVTLPPAVAGDTNGDGVVDDSEAAGVIQNLNASTLAVAIQKYWLTTTNRITSFSSVGPGLFQFGLTNTVGLNFTVMVSTNLVDWEELPDASSQFLFSDSAATNAPTRFYRLRWP